MCQDDHLYNPNAPHVDNDKFMEVLAGILWEKDPERIDAIQNFVNMHPSDPGPADWPEIIRKLKKKRDFLPRSLRSSRVF